MCFGSDCIETDSPIYKEREKWHKLGLLIGTKIDKTIPWLEWNSFDSAYYGIHEPLLRAFSLGIRDGFKEGER